MAEGAIRVDEAALERVLGVLSDLAPAADKALRACEEILGVRLRRLERAAEAAHELARRAARNAEEMARDADEEAADAAEAAAEAARERLERIERAMSEVRAAVAGYKPAARALAEARTGQFEVARQEMQAILDSARAYLAVSLHDAPGPGPARGDGGLGPLAQIALAALPPGFAWLPIAEVAEEEFLQDEAEWRKGISKAEMTAGVARFRDEVLPLLRENPCLGRDDLVARDRALGRTRPDGLAHPQSLAHLWDVFFGDSRMAAELYPDGRYRMANGRHRASMARELGLTHLPAQILGGRP